MASKTKDTEPKWRTTLISRPGPSAVTYHIPSSLTPPPSSPSPSSNTYPPPITRISLPVHSTWTSGQHFHATHTEYLHLLLGAIHVCLDGRHMILSAAAGGLFDPSTGHVEKMDELVVRVERFARHEWGRAEVYLSSLNASISASASRKDVGREKRRIYYPEDVHEEVLVEEVTEPGDLEKPLFFWNLNAVLTTHPPHLSTPFRKFLGLEYLIPIQLFTIFWALDNFPVILPLHGVLSPFLGWRVGGCVERGVEYVMSLVWVRIVSLVGWALGMRAVERERVPEGVWAVRHQEIAQRFYAWKGRS